MSKLPPISVHDLGGYLREQRQSAELSLRQLAEAAGISNPYLSQIERGLKKPSAEILQSLAKGLRISAESLYVRAGILEEEAGSRDATHLDVRSAILADPQLSNRQRAVLLDVYESFVGGGTPSETAAPPEPASPSAPTTSAGATSPEPAGPATP